MICHTGQVVAFNPERKVSDWVAYRLRREDLLNPTVERKDNFRPDPQVPEPHRVVHSDYTRTGSRRWQLASSGRRRGAGVWTPHRPPEDRSIAASLADIRVPPQCREMIRAGSLVSINTSGGKDSQAMTILLSRIVPRDRLVTVHAPLGQLDA